MIMTPTSIKQIFRRHYDVIKVLDSFDEMKTEAEQSSDMNVDTRFPIVTYFRLVAQLQATLDIKLTLNVLTN